MIVPKQTEVVIQYKDAEIRQLDSYEKCAAKLKDRTEEAAKNTTTLKKLVGEIHSRFAYPEIEKTLKRNDANKAILLKTLHAVLVRLSQLCRT